MNQTCFIGKSLNEHRNCIINKQAPQKAKRSILGALVGDSALINQLSANMNKALHIQDTNFGIFFELDKSIVNHLNSLLENEKSHDKDIRLVYQLVKSMGYYFDLIHNRAISFNLRTHQGHSIAHELTSLDKALGKLKDALHHTNQCTFRQCAISRHLNTINNEKLLLSEKVQRYRLDTHYLILCIPTSEHKVSSLHSQIGHKIYPHYLILESGERVPIEHLSNKTQANKHLQFITKEMLIFEDYPRYKNLI